MTNLDILILKGAISELPVSEQERVKECVEKLKAVVADYGDYGYVALALVVSDEND